MHVWYVDAGIEDTPEPVYTHCLVLMSGKSFSQRVVQEWNKLPQDVVEATSVNQFKNRLDKFWQRYGH